MRKAILFLIFNFLVGCNDSSMTMEKTVQELRMVLLPGINEKEVFSILSRYGLKGYFSPEIEIDRVLLSDFIKSKIHDYKGRISVSLSESSTLFTKKGYQIIIELDNDGKVMEVLIDRR